MTHPRPRQGEAAALTVRERFEAALHAYRHEHPTGQPTIALICRLAGLNRANVYASHPDLIAAVRVGRVPTATHRNQLPKSSPATAAENAEDAKRRKALLYVCLELRAEVESLRALRASNVACHATGKRSRR